MLRLGQHGAPPLPQKPIRPRILFMRGNDPFSLGVQMMTLSSISHVAVVLPQLDGGEDKVLHAAGRGVKLEKRSKLASKYKFTDVAEFEVLPDVRVGLMYILQQVGKPYDNEEIASRLLFRALQTVCPWITTDGKTSKGKWTCARLVVGLDPQRNKIPEWWLLDQELVSPVDMLDVTAKNAAGSFRRIR